MLNSLPSVAPGVMMMMRESDTGFDRDDEPFLSPEWLDHRTESTAESDNEGDYADDEDASRRFAETVRESAFLHVDDDSFMSGEAPFDYVRGPADDFPTERATDAPKVDIDFALKSAASLRDDDLEEYERECSAMERDLVLESQEHFATIADGRVFRVSSELVAPCGKVAKRQLEDSANGEVTEGEDSDADVVAQVKKVDTKKRRRREEEISIKRAKALKTIRKDYKAVRATDVFVMANGKKQRRGCLHCGTVKTPQWRMGPEGKKTLCNACGVRFMKGIL